ncbi:hypothetical protein GCM10007392_13300 [Saccharospirillum salsuginis]|uniref:Solute-binding protein family 3/N-terminal domain-containing protein n=2 Tax=Saccharospirillum salsuginis TaxID=418750 RepID=A0A918K6A7_9GAMM|nr:hypothetical protein GCM10007392_13300 [Saccharospirillum salsuginis]
MADDFVVGVENISYFPYYTTENGEYGGHARAILDAFAEDSGHTFTYRPLPVSRLMDTFLNGGVDFKYPDNPNWRADIREGLSFSYSDPVIGFIDGVAAPSRIENLEKLSTVRGFTPWTYMDKVNSGEITLHQQNNVEQLIQFVLAGRAQGAYFNIDVLRYQLREMNQEGALTFQEHLPHDQSFYYLSTLEHHGVIDEFSQWMTDNPERVEQLKKEFGLN